MKNQIKIAIFATILCCLPLFSSCEKEIENTTLPEGAMKISTEAPQSNVSKTTVENLMVYWVEGDMVNINGEEKPVQISDGTPYLMNIDNSSAMYAGFPAGIMSMSGSTITINYPHTYEYETSGGRQRLDLPMVAYAESGTNELEFIHANSTVEVRVKNSMGSTFTLDSITLISSSRAISGTGTFNPRTFAISVPTANEANKKVMMTFGSGLSISNGATQKIQIPVVPDLTSEGTTLTIRISGRPASVSLNNGKVNAAAKFVYVNSASVTLTRARVLPAPCTLSTTVPSMKIIYPPFSVSSTKKVYFSKGNLQYIASSDTWQFASTQTEALGAANSNISESYSSPIDLFGWGTGTNPTNTSETDGDYTWNEWGSRTLYGSSNWRTPTYDEWKYLLDTRSGNRYVKATVNGKYGIILFPDNYTPSISFSNINTREAHYNTNSVSSANWATLEAEGCIFLPQTALRYGTTVNSFTNCAYWSATSTDASQARRILAGTGIFYYNSSFNTNKHIGCAVRLVQDAN